MRASVHYCGRPRARDGVRIRIEGRPVAWQRATPVMVAGFPIMKTPKATRAYQGVIKQIACLMMRSRPPLTGPIEMVVTAYLPRPKTVDRELPHVQGTGDADNYSKTAQDALNGICFIDDAQICRLVSEKRYGTPALEIEVRPASGDGEA